jgi:DNA-directed RNA polymerase specialized sigma24 family protein
MSSRLDDSLQPEAPETALSLFRQFRNCLNGFEERLRRLGANDNDLAHFVEVECLSRFLEACRRGAHKKYPIQALMRREAARAFRDAAREQVRWRKQMNAYELWLAFCDDAPPMPDGSNPEEVRELRTALKLSPSEESVLALHLAGLSPSRIAASLRVKPGTVSRWFSRIRVKLARVFGNAPDPSEFVSLLREFGNILIKEMHEGGIQRERRMGKDEASGQSARGGESR